MIVPKSIYVDTMYIFANLFENSSELNYKFNDFATFIDTGAELDDPSTGSGGRAARYPELLNTFIENPLLGIYFLSDINSSSYEGAGAHLHWMNKLTVTGVIGFLLFIRIPYYHLKRYLRFYDDEYRFYFILASLAILSYGLIKAISGRDAWYVLFIVLPGLYYLPLLKKSKK